MRVRFLSQARAEWLDAVSYYNEQRAGLGYEFALQVDRTIERVVQFPEAWQQISGRTRRALIDRFPYGVLYTIDDDVIVVTAVMNLRRGPSSSS